MIDLSTVASEPIATPQIGGIQLYVYGPLGSDITKLEALSDTNAHSAFRTLVGLICSEVDITGKPREQLTKISDSNIDVLVKRQNELALALLNSGFLRWISKDTESPERTTMEDDVQLLMRSVQLHIKARQNHTRTLFASLSGADGSRFKELSRATDSLRSLADMNAPYLQQTRERERARELTAQEQTAEMTAKSSEALVKLIETTAIFIDEFDKRSQHADRTTAHQIVLAKRGIYVSAGLALVAMLLSGAALWQDYRNNTANDKWQDEVISFVKKEIERSSIDRETRAKTTIAIPLKVDAKKEHPQSP